MSPQALRRLFIVTLGTGLALWTVDQAMHNAHAIRRDNSHAEVMAIFRGPHWSRSETSRYIRQNPLHGVVLTNVLTQAYLNNPGRARYVPILWDRRPRSPQPHKHALESLAKHYSDSTYLVLWNVVNREYYPTILTRARITPGLRQLASLSDGAIFKVERGHVPPNPFRQSHRLIVAGALGIPAVRSTFDVYRTGRTLTYFKQPCLPEDTEAFFFVRFTVARSGPANEAYVGGETFNFWESGTILDDELCVAIAELPPELPIEHIHTGQFGSINWSAEPDVTGLGVLGA